MSGKAKKVSNLVSFLLKQKKKTLKEYSKEKGLAYSSICNQMHRAKYSVDVLIEIAEYLGVDVGFKDGENFYSFIEKRNDH